MGQILQGHSQMFIKFSAVIDFSYGMKLLKAKKSLQMLSDVSHSHLCHDLSFSAGRARKKAYHLYETFLVQEKECELLALDSEHDTYNIHELIPLSFSCLLVDISPDKVWVATQTIHED